MSVSSRYSFFELFAGQGGQARLRHEHEHEQPSRSVRYAVSPSLPEGWLPKPMPFREFPRTPQLNPSIYRARPSTLVARRGPVAFALTQWSRRWSWSALYTRIAMCSTV